MQMCMVGSDYQGNLFYKYIHMFNRKAIEALEVKNVETIEAITWPLFHNVELKANDADNDLVTLIKTTNTEGKEVIEYVRRSNLKDNDWIDDGVVKFTVEVPSVFPKEEIE